MVYFGDLGKCDFHVFCDTPCRIDFLNFFLVFHQSTSFEKSKMVQIVPVTFKTKQVKKFQIFPKLMILFSDRVSQKINFLS